MYEIRKIFRLLTGPVEFQVGLPKQTSSPPIQWVVTIFHFNRVKLCSKIEITGWPCRVSTQTYTVDKKNTCICCVAFKDYPSHNNIRLNILQIIHGQKLEIDFFVWEILSNLVCIMSVTELD